MKRFYKEVTIAPTEGGWRVLLDGRAIKTALGKDQVVPNEALASAMAAEWANQGEEIDTTRFLFRDLADYAIDIVRADRAAAIDGLLRFAETDTLCYRADPEEPLFRRQQDVWEPLLQAAEHRHDIHFERISGIMHRPQSPATRDALCAFLETQDDFTLAALNTLASLAASLTIALAALEDQADAKTLWDAANLEEDWQVELWGEDALAKDLRDKRAAEFANALRFAELVRTPGA